MKCIYKIINKVNGKFYVGSAENCNRRKSRHFSSLKMNKHHNVYLQRAYNKYGVDNFEFVILEECQKCKETEQEFLNSLDWSKSYNVSGTASGGDFIKNHPEKDRFIREAVERLKLIEKKNPRFKEENGNWKGGKTFCECGNRKQGNNKTCIKCKDMKGDKNPFYGKKHSEEVIKAISNKNSGRYLGNQEKPVIIEGVEYPSVSKAAKSLNVVAATILHRIKSINPKFTNYSYKTLTTIPKRSTLEANASGKAINPEKD